MTSSLLRAADQEWSVEVAREGPRGIGSQCVEWQVCTAALCARPEVFRPVNLAAVCRRLMAPVGDPASRSTRLSWPRSPPLSSARQAAAVGWAAHVLWHWRWVEANRRSWRRFMSVLKSQALCQAFQMLSASELELARDWRCLQLHVAVSGPAVRHPSCAFLHEDAATVVFSPDSVTVAQDDLRVRIRT